ncbi:conjugal transfer protein TrbD [uncultured Desulfovibrio sp.]|uniref:conjugal transfer protein TrbD n=1 Tax=uncultured Desulfovibrio sp. TaxID=167968 RepID=UPI0025A7DF26|nr:conjugal transfer protein TrbD [uncultured Desulfovibrio sp.]MDM8217280.1 conjugal transfer protein TrbD [Desulfovibrio piger]
MELRRIPVHSSLHRANLVMGAERELALGSALAALLVGIGGMSLVSAGAAIVFWFCAIWALRRMARADPMMSKVWLRHVRQQVFYSARSGRRIAAR